MVKNERCASMLEVYAFRHPQSQYNLEGKIQGQTDSPLSEDGLQQAKEVAEALKEIPFTTILTSDLQRCIRFAWEIAHANKRRGITLHLLPELRDRYLGMYEGQPYDVVGTIDDVFQMVLSREHIEGGESRKHFFSRGRMVLEVLRGFEKRGEESGNYERVLLSTHAPVIATLPSVFLVKPFIPEDCKLMGHAQYHHFYLKNGIVEREKDMQLYCSLGAK